MDNLPTSELPWDALKAAKGEIPWAALEQFADALAADSSLLCPLEDLHTEARETVRETERYEDLYVPAIVALAATRLSDEVRREVAAFLIDRLVEAGHEDDDIGLDVLTAAIGSLGPKVLPCILEATEKVPRAEPAWICLWQLTELAVQTEDGELRATTAKACMDLLRRAELGTVSLHDVQGAAWTLADLGFTDAIRPLQRLARRGWRRPSHIEIISALSALESGRRDRPRQVWEEPVKEWLESNWRVARAWYAEEVAERGEESIHDAGLGRAGKLAERFAESDAAKALPLNALEDAEFIADNVLSLAWSYRQARPEDLDEDILREVLVTMMPHKIVAEQSVFQNVVPVTRALLSWLQSEGILQNAAPLVGAVASWDRLIVERAMDSSGWDRTKRFLMQAQREGVELTHDRAMRRFMVKYNRQLRDEQGVEASDGPAVTPPGPSRKAVKIGRNEPCPCGSGRKYKHCCGRPGGPSR